MWLFHDVDAITVTLNVDCFSWVAAIQCIKRACRSALNRKRIEGRGSKQSKQVESGMLREQTGVLNVKQTNERVS